MINNKKQRVTVGWQTVTVLSSNRFCEQWILSINT